MGMTCIIDVSTNEVNVDSGFMYNLVRWGKLLVKLIVLPQNLVDVTHHIQGEGIIPSAYSGLICQ